MHGPNHGCPKCVINDGFIGPIAELLASTVGEESDLHKPSLALAAAANTATKVYEHSRKLGLRSMPTDHEFLGCTDATLLIDAVRSGGDGVTIEQLEHMRGKIIEQIAEHVAGSDIGA